MTQPQISDFQFEGFTKAASFDPLQLPDPSRLAESNIAVIRDNFNKMIQTGYEVEKSSLQKLVELAPTALQAVKEVQTFRVDQMRAEVEEEFFKNENAQFEAIAEYDKARSVANNVEAQLSEVGVRISGEGADASHQEYLQGVSGHKYTMYMEKYLNALGQQYGNFIEDQRANNEQEIQLANGTLVKINDPELSPQQDRALVGFLRNQFFTEKGIMQAPLGAKAKHLYPAMKTYEQKRNEEFVKQYGINTGPTARASALDDLLVTKDLQTYLNSVSVTVNTKGKQLGFPGAQTELKDALVTFARNQDSSYEPVLQAVLASKRFGAEFKADIASAVRSARNTAYDDQEKADKIEIRTLAAQAVAGVKAAFENDKPVNVADIRAMISNLQDLKPPFLNNEEAGITALIELEDSYTASARDIQGLREDAEMLAETRQLEPDHPYFGTLQGKNDEALLNKAKQFEKELLGDFFVSRGEQLETDVGSLYKFVSTILEPEAKGEVKEAINLALEMYEDRYRQLLEEGLDQNKASAQAKDEIFKSIEKNKTNPESRFYSEQDLKVPNIYGTQAERDAEDFALNKIANTLVQTLQEEGQTGDLFDAIENDYTKLVSKDQLREDLFNYQYNNGQVPGFYKQIANRLNAFTTKPIVEKPVQLLLQAAVGAGLLDSYPAHSLMIANLTQTTPQGRSLVEKIFDGEKVDPQQYLLPDTVEARQAVTRPKFRKTVQYTEGNPYQQSAISTIRFFEGTAGEEGANKLFGDRGAGRYGTLTNKTVAEVHNIQLQALQDPQARFTDLRGNTNRSAAVGTGQFINMIETAQRMGVDVNKKLFDLPFQHRMMVFYAKEQGIDLSKKLTLEEWKTLGSIWAGISQNLGQTETTAEESYQFYLDDLARRGTD